LFVCTAPYKFFTYLLTLKE